MEISMKCKDCNTVNFAIPYAEKDTRRCKNCGGELKELTVDMKEDGESGKPPFRPVFVDILRVVLQKNSASISLIQRCCAVGYIRAGEAIDWMEENGYISPYEEETPRKVLITKEQFEEKYGPLEPNTQEPPKPQPQSQASAQEVKTPVEVPEELLPVYIAALKKVIEAGSASISIIQRKCNRGYNFSAKILDWMESLGYVTPFDGEKLRKVLITKEQFEEKYGKFDDEQP